MKRRQTKDPRTARRWLVADERMGVELWNAVRKLPRGSGVLVLYPDLPKGERAKLVARLRHIARVRGLVLADESAGEAVRVHNLPELRRALYRRVPMILLSPLNSTRSHPEWRPIGRMRAAALARLSGRRLLALGGMNERKFRRIECLGFQGWAGIDAWLRDLR
ncbi:MAG: thiamine phosphate synthase [Sphingomicrobium sp.]